MSVVVLAYHEMGYRCLRTLLERGVSVSSVFTYEDDPQENCWFGSVAALARDAGLPTFTTSHINEPRWVSQIAELQPDLIFSFHYRHLLKRPIRDLPRRGAINLHSSLLPKYRGRCPVNWQLIHGESTSGVTLHHMVARADAGDVIARRSVPVGPDESALDLYRKLVAAGCRLLASELESILDGSAPRSPQDESQATVFGGRTAEDGRIDWQRQAREIHDLVRAVAPPWPGAFSDLADGRLMVRRSRCEAQRGVPALAPGRVRRLGERTFVGTGDLPLELLEFEAPDGRRLATGERLDAGPGARTSSEARPTRSTASGLGGVT